MKSTHFCMVACHLMNSHVIIFTYEILWQESSKIRFYSNARLHVSQTISTLKIKIKLKLFLLYCYKDSGTQTQATETVNPLAGSPLSVAQDPSGRRTQISISLNTAKKDLGPDEERRIEENVIKAVEKDLKHRKRHKNMKS